MKKRLFLLTALCGILFLPSPAQQVFQKVYRFPFKPDSAASGVVSGISLFRKNIEKEVRDFHRKGFVSTMVDTLYAKNDTLFAALFVSEHFRTVTIRKIVQEGGLTRPSFYPSENKNLRPRDFFHLEEDILSYWENNGHPFCSVSLQSITAEGSQLSGELQIDLHRRVLLDSILLKGKARIHPGFVYRYIGFSPGAPYSEKKLRLLRSRLSGLVFISQSQPPQVVFTEKYSRLSLFLEPKKANQFDGILGFLPNNQTGKILFTGQMHIKLLNALSRGETMELDWRKLQPLTQDLKLNLQYPYLFGTPLGLDYAFSLYKRDTTFLEVKNHIGLQYLFSGGNFIKFFYHVKTSNVISVAGFSSLTTLPDYADVSVRSYGAGWNLDRTDYRFNPRKGFRSNGAVSIGMRAVRKNTAIPENLYEGIAFTSLQYSGSLQADAFVPLAGRVTWLCGARAAFITGNNLFSNELYRLGGLQSLRGFDDESLFVSSYAWLNNELRYLSGKNSNLFLFYTYAYTENLSRNVRRFDRPFSLGAGINFETKAGIFNLTYALGKQLNNPLLLRAAKIHFGIVSVF